MSQLAFEEVFLDIARPIIDKYDELPIIMVGGCGLNILLNTRIEKEFNRPVFVPPNPNDCGIAAGMILGHIKPKKAIDLTYSGSFVLDQFCVSEYVESRNAVEYSIPDLAGKIKAGDIVGVVRGRSEHGPRALGNRSIICNPAIADMKDILNKKVKNREWYRPFAPVCRLQDINKYFHRDTESRWMCFCPEVREEWRSRLPSITHIDNTARVQTVTYDQNPWLYDLLTEFEQQTGVGDLLNTSFNVNGKPILSTYRDAIDVFDKTSMDLLVLDKYLFHK